MTAEDCERWAALSDRVAIEEPIAPAEAAFLAAHPRQCSACAAEVAVYGELARIEPPLASDGPQRERTVARWIAAGGAVLAAAALLLWLRPAALFEPRKSSPPMVATAPRSEVLAPTATSIAAGDTSVCEAARGAVVCVAPRGEVEPTPSGYRLLRGEVFVVLERRAPGDRFVIEADGAQVEALGTVFAVATGAAARVRLFEGRVAVHRRGRSTTLEAGRAIALESGSERALQPTELEEARSMLPPETHARLAVEWASRSNASRPEASASEPRRARRTSIAPAPDRADPAVEDPATELREARRLRAAGDLAAAAAAYDSVVERHGATAEGRAALVPLGELRLALRQPARALQAFDRYGAGSLRPEAELGRIRALRMLGRSADERRSIERFVREHPEHLETPRLRARLSEAEADGDR